MSYVFLTGASGFIGRHLVKQLLKNGYNVINIKRELFTGSNAIDLLNFFKTVKISDNSVLIHLAAAGVNEKLADDEYQYVNVVCTEKLLKCASEAGIQASIITGTCFEYGLSGEHYDRIPTWAELRPIGAYAKSKAAAFGNIVNNSHFFKKGISYLRLFQVYGEGEPSNRLYPSLLMASKNNLDFEMSDGLQIRDFTFVGDVVSYIMREINLINGLSVVNVSSGYGTSVKDFALYYWRQTAARGKINFGAVERKQQSLAKIVGEPTVDESRFPIPAFHLHSIIRK